MFRDASASRGFTFLEIMLVIVIISILTSFAIPTIRSSLYTDQLKKTARLVVGLVSEASQEAVRKQATYSLNFDIDENRVWLNMINSTRSEFERVEQRVMNLPDSVELVDIATLSGGKQAQGTTSIQFNKKGYVDKTLIHLRSDDGRDMTLMLSPFLAVTRIYDSYLEMDDERINFGTD